MGCKKKEPPKKPKPGRFECGECGTVQKKKKDLCDPKKIKAKK